MLRRVFKEDNLGEMKHGFEVRNNGGDICTYFDTDTSNSVPYNHDRYCVVEDVSNIDGIGGCIFVAQVGAPDPKDDILQSSINSGLVVTAS